MSEFDLDHASLLQALRKRFNGAVHDYRHYTKGTIHLLGANEKVLCTISTALLTEMLNKLPSRCRSCLAPLNRESYDSKFCSAVCMAAEHAP